MDLLSPCRSCLQCLPFFHVSPPSSPRRAVAAPSTTSHSQEALKGTDPLPGTEDLPCPPAAHATQAQGVSPPTVEEQKGTPQDGSCFEGGVAGKPEGSSPTATESDVVAPAMSGIVIAPPVSANSSGPSTYEDTEQNKGETLSEGALNVPFINDVSFAPPGFMSLPSPITPELYGSGYPAGQYPLHEETYQGQQHEHGAQEKSHHDQDCTPQGTTAEHANSHHEVVHGHGVSHHRHDHSHHGHEHHHLHHDHLGSEHGHWHASPHSEAPIWEQSQDFSKSSDELCKGDNFSQHVDHHSHDTAMALHGAEDNEDDHLHQVEVAAPVSSLETSSSTPELDTEAEVDSKISAVSATNLVPAMVESYHSEPVVVFEGLKDEYRKAEHDEVLSQHSASQSGSRRRHREHFKDQLKGIKQQIKRGGLHIKEEGNKHMQTIMENVNKHAQQMEEFGSFSIVPRANNN